MTILEIESLFKTFGPVKALNDVSLSVEEGETMAIVGQNGAGKSTLVKILTGAYQKSSGQIRLEGKDVTISSPQVAKRLGIAEVYQQAELIPEFTVAENVVIGYPEYSSKGFVNRRRLEKAVQEMLDRYQIPLRAEQKVGELSAALRQLVAIMKVLFGRPKVLIWDEPTAVLSDREVEILFRIIKELKQLHVTMIYISHRLEEIFQICDRVAVMRDGQLITVLRNEGLTKEQLDSERVHISEATVFSTTVEAGGCDIGSEEYPWLQYDVESLGGFRPEIPGLKPVRNFSAFLKRKLYTYNAASCVIAYLGWLKGCTDYAEAANDEVIGRLLDENYAETNAAVCREYGYDMADQQEFARLSKAKFCNRKIADTLERNARQPERKITRDERVIAPLLLIAKYGGDPRILEMTAAAMLLYDGEGEEAWRAKVRDLGPAGVLREVCGLGDEPALCEGILGYYELFTADKRANANLLDSLSRKKG